MNTIHRALVSILVVASIWGYPQVSIAEGFTGHKFLTWDRRAQDSLIQTSITMIGIVASQTELGIAPCIDGWYAPDEPTKKRRHDFVLQTVRKHPDYHPQAVILAVVQKRCGTFEALD